MSGWLMRITTVERAQPQTTGGRYSARMTKRTDRLTAFYIDLAVNLAGSHGVAAGARMLLQLGLPVELAHRVLLRTQERRGTGATRSVPSQPAAAGPAPAR